MKEEIIMNLPTKITVTRMICTVMLIVTLFVLSLFPDLSTPELGNTKINLIFLVIFVFFVIASYTDHLDGKLARKNNQVTNLGKFLDPIADKLLVDSMIIFLACPQLYGYACSTQTVSFNVWCVMIMIVRDIIIDAIRQIGAQRGVTIAANYWGKVKTVLQMIAIGAALLNDFPFHYMYGGNYVRPELTVTSFIIYLATIVSVISCVMYLVQNRKVWKEEK